jgi:hypothetical protein
MLAVVFKFLNVMLRVLRHQLGNPYEVVLILYQKIIQDLELTQWIKYNRLRAKIDVQLWSQAINLVTDQKMQC